MPLTQKYLINNALIPQVKQRLLSEIKIDSPLYRPKSSPRYHSNTSVSNLCTKEEIEAIRWKQLAKLEKSYYALLSQKNLIDPFKLSKNTAATYQINSSISKIILAATPDPKPLPLKALQSLESKMAIEVWINGPEKECLFDDWEIPIQKSWEQRLFDFTHWNYEIIRINNALEIPKKV